MRRTRPVMCGARRLSGWLGLLLGAAGALLASAAWAGAPPAGGPAVAAAGGAAAGVDVAAGAPPGTKDAPGGAPVTGGAPGDAGTGSGAGSPLSGTGTTGSGSGAGGGADAPGDAPGDASVPAVGRVWPVGVRPPVLRGWDPPATTYGRGHRGVDLGAPPEAVVRAVAAGRVSFAGRVAGRGVVSVELAGTGTPALRTTYEPVRASVREGEAVTAGQVVGTLETAATRSHCGSGCLHWGLLRERTYLNPLLLLPPWLRDGGPPRLLPVLGVPMPKD
jgi:murein DD-endopeptidase MepM/ murein hydrolase activator NlpD